ncbi:inositol monophosphatase family protein [Gemmata sp.]|uniref:inositol monophosphatase family protein n=1 Tax=Gemmata sp. TaxID=1914242 RepID=UPI003F7252A0
MSTPDRTQLAKFLSVAVEAAARGAAELESWRSRFSVTEKSRADLVTDADHASQRVVKEVLLGAFPDHLFLGEEECVGKTVEETRPPAGAPFVWVVDPLDGTANYVHDVPAYCVSIGLWAHGTPAVGVIHDPRLNEVFTAATGLGAFLNGKPMKVSGVSRVADAMLSTGFPANYAKALSNLETWAKLLEHAQSLRRTGSTALNLAYVAAGRFDGYWAHDNYPWDVLAGAVLVAEAGGALTTIDGKPLDPFRPDILATNGRFHAELLAAVQA